MRLIETAALLAAASGLTLGTAANAQVAGPTPPYKDSAVSSTSQAVEESSSQVDDIVVTAQRREARLQDVPVAISAISGESLRSAGGLPLTDLAQRVPSLTFAQSFGISQIFIRGVGNNFFSPGGDPGVATYADGVYLSDQEATAIAFLDLSRIEVLRGPQPALYGRNATGGAINIISEAPTSRFAGRAGLRVGDYGRVEGDGFLSGRLAESVNARASIQYRRLEGFTRNELAGAPGARSWLDDEESLSGRLQAAFDLGGGSLRLIANGFTQDDGGPAIKVLADPTPQPAEILFGARPSTARRSLESQIADNRRDVWSATSILTQPVGDADLTVIADYRRSKRAITSDEDGTERDVSVTTLDTRSHQASVEAYVSGSSGALDWLVGASYLWFDQSRVTTVTGVLPAAFLDPALPVTTPFPFRFDGGGTVTTDAWAAYADGGLRLSEQIKLRLGVRYGDDAKEAEEFLTFLAPTVTGRSSDSWDQLSGRVGIDITPRDGSLFYGSVSRGFKSGALNVGAFTPPVDPELITSYELGTKTETFDRRLQLNLAVFVSDYQDLQIVQVGPISQILSNAADSSIRGLEVELTARPDPRLSLGLSGSYLDAEFGTFSSLDQRRGFQTFDVTGNRLPLTSQWQGTLTGAYEIPLSGGSTLDFNAALQLRSEYYFTEFNTADARQPGFARVDLGASWTSGDGRLRAFVFARNLSDETVFSSLSVGSPLLGSLRMASLEPPRHVGFGLDVNF